jgi:hypothetical protein
MNDMERARKAGGSGVAFTAAVVLAIIACIASFVWRATSQDGRNQPPPTINSR